MKYLVLFEGTEALTSPLAEIIGLYNSVEEAKETAEGLCYKDIYWEEAYPNHEKGIAWIAEANDRKNFFYTIREI
jgi:hypothetical protein